MSVLGDSVSIIATFRDGPSGPLLDPDSITVKFEVDGVEISQATPTTTEYLSPGRYKILWEPDTVGSYEITITGHFIGDSDIVLSQVIVVTEGPNEDPDPSLGRDVVVTFSSGFDPLLVDPESILPYLDNDEITQLDIAQLVHKFSIEAMTLFPNGDYPPVAFDYIHAAVLCALSRIHEGIGSASNYSGFTLGDLQVMDSGGGKSAAGKNRGNIDSWCGLAELLRMEMRNANGGMTSARKASRWGTPYPNRSLRKAGHKAGGRRY